MEASQFNLEINKDLVGEKRHPIRVVARRTGLTQEVLRAWEIRYKAVIPDRSDGGQRLYSDLDIERLNLIQQVLRGGRRIGQVAALTTDELKSMVAEDGESKLRLVEASDAPPPPTRPQRWKECCGRQAPPLLVGLAYSFQQVRQLDARAWDIPMDLVITEVGTVDCRAYSRNRR